MKSLRQAGRAFVTACSLAAGATSAFPTDAEVREMLRQRVEVGRLGVGIVAGMVDASGSRVVAFGHARRGNDERVTGDTVFELGSITKVFTSLLLAQMVEAGEVRLQDPIALHAPPTVKSPRTREVTLLHLSRHTAGFPPWPDNMRPVDPANPRDVYTTEALFAFLETHRTRREAGTFQLYSNYGVALLGELLARRANTGFEAALTSRVLEPLAMRSTGIRLTPALRAAHALGHTSLLQPIALGDVRGMPAAGSLRSTANDMVRFLEAELGLRASSLATAMRATHETRADRQMPDLPMGLGWFHTTVMEQRLVVHGGATEGFAAYVALDLAGRRGVVILSNSDHEVQNIAIHLLVPSVPLYKPDPPEK